MAENEISILVKAEVSKALSEMKKVEQAPKTISQNVEKYLSKLGDNIKGFFTGLGAAIIAGGAIKAIGDLTKKGIEFLDLQDDFNQLFGGIAYDANKMRDSLVQSLGISTEQATKMLSQVGQLAQSMGITTAESLRMAGRIAELSVAIERYSPTGVTAAEATSALTAALNGQDRGLRQLGISVSEQDKLQTAARMGIAGTTAEWTKQQAAQVILQIAYEKSGKAIEGLDAKNRSLADTLKIAGNRFDDIKTAVGIELAGALSQVLPNLDSVGASIDDIRKIARPVINVISALAQTMILAFTIPASVIVATVKSVVKLAQDTAELTSLMVDRNFKGAANAAVKLGKDVGKAVADIATAPLDVIKSTGSAYLTAFKSITGQITIEEAKNDKVQEDRNNKRITDNAAVNVGILESEKKRLEEQKKIQEQYDADIATYNAFIAADEEAKKTAALEKQYVQALEAADRLGLGRNAVMQAHADALAEIEKQAAIKTAQEWTAAFSAIGNAAAAWGDFAMQIVENQIAAENKGGKAMSDEQKKRLKDTAIAQKAFAVFSAITNTAAAIVAQLTNPVPFAGAVLSAAAGVAGAAQIATILAEPIPEFALGGIVNGPQMIMAGERGREAVLPNELTELLLSAAGSGRGGGTVNIGQVVANDPQQFAAALDRHLKTRGNWITV
jgi:hypothetical protein